MQGKEETCCESPGPMIHRQGLVHRVFESFLRWAWCWCHPVTRAWSLEAGLCLLFWHLPRAGAGRETPRAAGAPVWGWMEGEWKGPMS